MATDEGMSDFGDGALSEMEKYLLKDQEEVRPCLYKRKCLNKKQVCYMMYCNDYIPA